jgi:transcriptional regulator with XRE-family HTH domain
MKRIGERIRKKRELLDLQLKDLSKMVGITSSALSQIEKAKAFPSIVTLKSIAENLHTTVGELIGENESLNNNPVVLKNDIKFVKKNTSGTKFFLLSHHDINKQMEPYFIRFIKGSDLSGMFTNNHGQIFCYVILGDLNFNLNGKTYLLGSGDSIYFNSKASYYVKNDTDINCELLLIISPPSL